MQNDKLNSNLFKISDDWLYCKNIKKK